MVQGGKQSQNEAHISQPKLDLILNAKKPKQKRNPPTTQGSYIYVKNV